MIAISMSVIRFLEESFFPLTLCFRNSLIILAFRNIRTTNGMMDLREFCIHKTITTETGEQWNVYRKGEKICKPE
jgi:hypothetical protein